MGKLLIFFFLIPSLLSAELDFPGSAAYDIGANIITTPLTGASVIWFMAWIKPTSTVTGGILDVCREVVTSGISISFTAGSIVCTATADQFGTPQTATVAYPFATGEYHHVACKADIAGDSILVYFDGVLAKTQAVTFVSTTYQASGGDQNYDDHIGSNLAASAFYTGEISEVRVYKTDVSNYFTSIPKSKLRLRLTNGLVYYNSLDQLGPGQKLQNAPTIIYRGATAISYP